MTQPLDPNLTPEWLQNIGILAVLDNLIFDIGKAAAGLTMLHLRAGDLRALIQQEVEKNGSDDRAGDTETD